MGAALHLLLPRSNESFVRNEIYINDETKILAMPVLEYITIGPAKYHQWALPANMTILILCTDGIDNQYAEANTSSEILP